MVGPTRKAPFSFESGIGMVGQYGLTTGRDGLKLMSKVFMTLILAPDYSLLGVDIVNNLGQDIAADVWSGTVQTQGAVASTLTRPGLGAASLNNLTPAMVEAGALHTYNQNFGRLRTVAELLDREIESDARPEWQRWAFAQAKAYLTALYGPAN